MMRHTKFAMGLAGVAAMVLAATANAGLVRGSVTSKYPANDEDGLVAANICDNNIATEWATKSTATDGYYFHGGLVPELTVDLGSTYSLSGLAYWGYGNSGNNAKSLTLAFSTDGATYGSSVVYTPAAPLAPGSEARENVYQQNGSFGAVDARYVRITVTDNWFQGICANSEPCTGGDRVGFSEIAFVVPEPASLGLLAIGGLFVLRRRRS